jgi:hypothetical protein
VTLGDDPDERVDAVDVAVDRLQARGERRPPDARHGVGLRCVAAERDDGARGVTQVVEDAIADVARVRAANGLSDSVGVVRRRHAEIPRPGAPPIRVSCVVAASVE